MVNAEPNADRGPDARQDGLVHLDMREVAEAEHPSSREFKAVWFSYCRDGQLMSYRQIPGRPLAKLLSHIFLVQPLDAGADWLYRVVGSAIRDRFGIETTGRRMSELFSAAQHADRAAAFRRLTQERRIRITQGHYVGVDRDHVRCENILLPVAGAHDETWIVGLMSFFEDARSTRRSPRL